MLKKSVAVILLVLIPGFAFGAEKATVKQPNPTKGQPMATQDLSTVTSNHKPTDTLFLSFTGTQGSNGVVKPLIACDQNAGFDLTNGGKSFGSDSEVVNVCSFSISNGPNPQIVQFIKGTSASAGDGESCSNIAKNAAISSKLHLAPYQFISQGAGVGVLFKNEGAVCIKLFMKGDVGVNVTYAGTPFVPVGK